MKKNNIYYMCLCAIFIALTFIITLYINVPLGIFNINLGDSIILISTLFLPFYFACFTSIGAFIADIVGGYASFAFFTLFIKFFEAILVSLIFKNLKFKKNINFLIASFLGILIMPIGYFFTNWFLFSFQNAILAIGYDFIQAFICFIVSNLLFIPLSRIRRTL